MQIVTTREGLERAFQVSTPTAVSGCCLETVSRAAEERRRGALTCAVCSNRLTPGTPILDPMARAGMVTHRKAPRDQLILRLRGVLVSELDDRNDSSPALTHLRGRHESPAEDRKLARVLREVQLSVPQRRYELPRYGGGSQPVLYSEEAWSASARVESRSGHHYFLPLSDGVVAWFDQVEEPAGVS